MPALSRVTLGSRDHGLRARFVDRLVTGHIGHESGSFRGELSDPDRGVGGDEQRVVLGSAEAEVHGSGRPDLTDQLTAWIEYLDSGERRGIDSSFAVDLQPVREPGADDGQQPLAAEAAAAKDVERLD